MAVIKLEWTHSGEAARRSISKGWSDLTSPRRLKASRFRATLRQDGPVESACAKPPAAEFDAASHVVLWCSCGQMKVKLMATAKLDLTRLVKLTVFFVSRMHPLVNSDQAPLLARVSMRHSSIIAPSLFTVLG